MRAHEGAPQDGAPSGGGDPPVHLPHGGTGSAPAEGKGKMWGVFFLGRKCGEFFFGRKSSGLPQLKVGAFWGRNVGCFIAVGKTERSYVL